jgi:hypothetical protein
MLKAAVPYNRVVQQAATLSARVAGGADPLAPQQLINLLRALTGCLSLLRQRVHDELLAQALGVSLWSCSQVLLCSMHVPLHCHSAIDSFAVLVSVLL